jgi:hypothetical protein
MNEAARAAFFIPRMRTLREADRILARASCSSAHAQRPENHRRRRGKSPYRSFTGEANSTSKD